MKLPLILFVCFAFGLPIWAMQSNDFPSTPVHNCSGDCYAAWREDTGGVVEVLAAQQAAQAAASPAELGETQYAGCVACHGAAGEGGIGPQLAGQGIAAITDKLLRYKQGETIGAQSNLMWAQASLLSEEQIDQIAAYVDTL